MRYAFVILVGRAVRYLAQKRKPGGGSAIPGLVMNKLAPGYLAHALKKFPDGLIVVSGSAGKSTTTKMLTAVLRAHGSDLFTNPSTANIRQGITSALLERSNWRGKVPGTVAVLELDEGHGAALARELPIKYLALTNVMLDQIDRFFDPELVTGMLETMASHAQNLIINADDGALFDIGGRANTTTTRFGASEMVLQMNDLGNTSVSPTRMKPEDGVIITNVVERTATLQDAGTAFEVRLPAPGAHYALNAAAAYATAKAVLGTKFDSNLAVKTLSEVPAVFGRGQMVTVRDQKIEFVLVQNPTSFALNIDALGREPAGVAASPLMFAIGTDVRDPSYLWPVDARKLGRVAVVSGAKSAEAALLLGYHGVQFDRVEDNLETGIEVFLAIQSESHKTIVFTADAMRKTRKYLGLTDTE